MAVFGWRLPSWFSVPGISRYYWAAACHGEEGIIRLVEQLNAELRLTMAQLGVAQVKDLTTRLDAGKVVWGGVGVLGEVCLGCGYMIFRCTLRI